MIELSSARAGTSLRNGMPEPTSGVVQATSDSVLDAADASQETTDLADSFCRNGCAVFTKIDDILNEVEKKRDELGKEKLGEREARELIAGLPEALEDIRAEQAKENALTSEQNRDTVETYENMSVKEANKKGCTKFRLGKKFSDLACLARALKLKILKDQAEVDATLEEARKNSDDFENHLDEKAKFLQEKRKVAEALIEGIEAMQENLTANESEAATAAQNVEHCVYACHEAKSAAAAAYSSAGDDFFKKGILLGLERELKDVEAKAAQTQPSPDAPAGDNDAMLGGKKETKFLCETYIPAKASKTVDDCKDCIDGGNNPDKMLSYQGKCVYPSELLN